MRGQRIQSVGLLPAFLAAVVLVVSPVSDTMAQPTLENQEEYLGSLWDHQANWFDQGPQKALRATPQEARWAVLVKFEEAGRWHHQGFLQEISRSRLPAPEGMDETLKATFDSLEPAVLVGEVRSSMGIPAYVVAAVLEQATHLSDSAGRTLIPLVPLFVTKSHLSATEFAATYQQAYAGTAEPDAGPNGPLEEEFDFYPAGSCENACNFAYQSGKSQCTATYSGCVALAAAEGGTCVFLCAGIPICEALCLALGIARVAACLLSYDSCVSTQGQIRDLCIGNCASGGGPGCSATATQTATAALSLAATTAGGLELTPTAIDFSLARWETRGQESFIVDEWAIVQNGRATASSNPAFGRAVTDQGAAPPLGSFLMIQEPVHAMNSRHLAKPEVRISSTGLAPSERGEGELVAARLEFSPARVVDRVEIVYTSAAMDEVRLEQLVRRRVGVVFASDKEHRTAVYVIFRLTDRFELLGTFTALPQCCCGEVFCI